jgi:hypothetical protein
MISIQMKDIPIQNDTPVLSYCRQLIKEGVNPRTKFKVYRGDVLALSVKTIGRGAKLTVKNNNQGTPVFRWHQEECIQPH